MHFGDVGVDENDTYRKLPHMGLFVLAWRGIVYSLTPGAFVSKINVFQDVPEMIYPQLCEATAHA